MTERKTGNSKVSILVYETLVFFICHYVHYPLFSTVMSNPIETALSYEDEPVTERIHNNLMVACFYGGYAPR